MFYVIPDIVESVVKHLIKLVTMLYVIPNTLLKVLLNTIKLVNMFYAITNIVESGVKHQ